MKRLIGAALALSLLGATAASAAPAPNVAPRALQQIDYRDHSYRHRDNGNGAAVAAGIGFLALAAILASQNNHDRDGWYSHDRGWHDRDWRDRDYSYRSYDQGYGDRGYGYRSYDNRGYDYSSPYSGYRGW